MAPKSHLTGKILYINDIQRELADYCGRMEMILGVLIVRL